MLSLPQIQRHLLSGEHDQLLHDLSRNGTLLPLPIRIQLAGSASACRALALRRVAELTHGPTLVSRIILDRLISAEAERGHDGDSVVALAAQLAGLARALALETVDPDEAEAVHLRMGELAFRLSAMQGSDGLLGGSEDQRDADRVRNSAFAVYLLAPVHEAASGLDLAALLTALEERRPLDDSSAEELVEVALSTWPRGHQPGKRLGVTLAA
jgi:hypothetical protein